jgi:[ribosomal protein S18]-alanine N-acetyltransferase
VSALHIRRAADADVQTLAQLHQDGFDLAWDADSFTRLLGTGGMAWIADKDQKAAGFALIRLAADEAEVLSIGVIKSQRQRHIGHKLLETACKGAQSAGASALFLEVAHDNQAACRLYERSGFLRIGKRAKYYANGADALVLKKRLL